MPIDAGANARGRAALKGFFVRNAIPTEEQFASLIDSMVNVRDDGVTRPAGDPLSIEASGDAAGFGKAASLYLAFADAAPAWTVALRPRANPADPRTARPGFAILDGGGNARLSIDQATGSVGIGTVVPRERLEVGGRVRAGDLVVGPWPANGNYAFVGAGVIDQAQPGNYALLQGTAVEQGVTYLNSPSRIGLRINNGEKVTITADGPVVQGPLKINSGLWDLSGTEGDLRVGSDRYRLKIGVALGGGGAGDARLRSVGGTNRLILGGGGVDMLTVTPTAVGIGTLDPSRGALHVQGDLFVTGRIGSMNAGPGPKTAGWGGGLRTFDVEAEGTVWSRGAVQTGPRDLAETYFSGEPLEPGDVVSLAPQAEEVMLSRGPGDARAIGVVSTEPGVILGSLLNLDGETRTGFPVALLGCVPCKVTAEGGAIARGDLLTSAATPGHAMRADDGPHPTGAIIGKALTAHAADAGAGVIDIFVMLR